MIKRMKQAVALEKVDPDTLPLDRRIHVLVLHGDSVIGAGLTAILSGHCNMRVIRGSLGHDQELAGFDVIVASPDVGLRCLERPVLASEVTVCAAPKVLMIASEAREAEVWRAFSAGASGYVRLGCEPEDVTEAVCSVVNGGRYLCPATAQIVAEGISHAALTSRECDVLDLIAVGQSNKVIARALGIELGTVKGHVKAIFGKLKAATRTEASAIAIKRGLVGRQPFAQRNFRQPGATISASSFLGS